jgi:PEP-CTERM motif
MKRSSYLFGFLFIALFLLSTGTAAKADSTDPQILLGPTGSNPCSAGDFSCTQTNCSPQFFACTLTLTNGSGTADILNDTGQFIIQDVVKVLSGFTGGLSCAVGDDAPGWSTPTPSPTGNSCTFVGGFISPGFTYGLTFGSFTGNAVSFETIGTTVPTVPEPGTMTLLGTGLALILLSRTKVNGISLIGFGKLGH